jgi:hypothetical protein
MLLVEEAVRILLAADAGVSAIAGTRIVNGFLDPAISEPAIGFKCKKIGDLDTDSCDPSDHRGISGVAEYEIAIYSVSKGPQSSVTAKLVARRLDDAVRLAIDGYQGTVSDSGSPPSSNEIQRITFKDGDDGYFDTSQTHQFLSVYEVVAEEQRPLEEE